MRGVPRTVSSATPRVITPAVDDVILCHATAVRIKVEPDDAMLCFTVCNASGVPLSPCVPRGAKNGIYAGNLDFGPLPSGAAVLHICYAKDGVSCSSGMGACSLIPIIVECRSET